MPEHVIWHDVECGRYDADIALWRELAAAADGPILDVGAGTGRVTLDLARRGHDVVALDIDPALLAELERRARARGPARARPSSPMPRDFALRAARLRARHGADADRAAAAPGGPARLPALRPRARRAAAASSRSRSSTRWRPSTTTHVLLPLPDQLVIDGTLYSSQPVALRDHGDTRRDRAHPPDRHAPAAGAAPATTSCTSIASRSSRSRPRAAPPAWRSLPGRIIAETEEHVGTSVVMLRG